MVAQLEGIGLAILADGPALRCAGDRLTILAVGQQAEEHIVGQAAGLHCGDVVRVHRLWFAVIADAQHLLGLSGTAYREREANAERRVLGRVLECGEKHVSALTAVVEAPAVTAAGIRRHGAAAGAILTPTREEATRAILQEIAAIG